MDWEIDIDDLTGGKIPVNEDRIKEILIEKTYINKEATEVEVILYLRGSVVKIDIGWYDGDTESEKEGTVAVYRQQTTTVTVHDYLSPIRDKKIKSLLN